MRFFLKFITLCILYHFSFNVRSTTYDEQFEDLYDVVHIRKGDGVTYPTYYKFVRLRFKGFIPSTGSIFDSTDLSGGLYEFQFRRKNIKTSFKHVPCWEDTIFRMSKGERIIINCQSAYAFQSQGLLYDEKYLVKPGEDVAYELEMVEAAYDPFNIQIIKNGIDNRTPKHNDILTYTYEVWVDKDKDFIITKFNILNSRKFGSVFHRSGDSICILEALRNMSVGAISELYCPWYYRDGGKNFPEFYVPSDADLGYRIELLTITPAEKVDELHKHLYTK